jgi:metal transporter CNNM
MNMSVSESKEGVVMVPPMLPGSPKSSIGHGHGVSAKGTRFKSSPLGGVERAGVVVAEQVKAVVSALGKEGGAEEGVAGEGEKV